MKYLFVILLGFVTTISIAQVMDYSKMDNILHAECDSVVGGNGAWQLFYRGRMMMLIADVGHNRMRIISPIITREELGQTELENALIANFHSVLDAKYALSEGVMWSAFIHPLKELSETQLRDALSQVFLSAETFGTNYRSTELVFPSQPKEEAPVEEKTKKQKL